MIKRSIVLFPDTINKIYIRTLTSVKTKSQQQQAPRGACVQPGLWVS